MFPHFFFNFSIPNSGHNIFNHRFIFFVGNVTEKVIREVPCNFITLKSQDFIELKLESEITDFEVRKPRL